MYNCWANSWKCACEEPVWTGRSCAGSSLKEGWAETMGLCLNIEGGCGDISAPVNPGQRRDGCAAAVASLSWWQPPGKSQDFLHLNPQRRSPLFHSVKVNSVRLCGHIIYRSSEGKSVVLLLPGSGAKIQAISGWRRSDILDWSQDQTPFPLVRPSQWNTGLWRGTEKILEFS